MMCCLRSDCLLCLSSSSPISQLTGWKRAEDVGSAAGLPWSATVTSHWCQMPVPGLFLANPLCYAEIQDIEEHPSKSSGHTHFCCLVANAPCRAGMKEGLLPKGRTTSWLPLLALWDVQFAGTGYINLVIYPHILTLKKMGLHTWKGRKGYQYKAMYRLCHHYRGHSATQIGSNCIYSSGTVTRRSQFLPGMSLFSTHLCHRTATSLPHTQFAYRYSKSGLLRPMWRDQLQAIRDAVLCAAGIRICGIWWECSYSGLTKTTTKKPLFS